VAVVRIEALRGLLRAIKCAVPELEARICPGQAPPDKERVWPHLNVDLGRLRYAPDQASDHHDPGGDRLVVNVGHHQGPALLRLGAQTLGQRYELEQKLLDLFLSQDAPGILITPITSAPELGTWVVEWMLDDDEWQDDRAFDRQFFSVITLTVTIPALVTRCGVHTINDLRLGLADLGAVATPSTFGSAAEVVRINDDGTLTPL